MQYEIFIHALQLQYKFLRINNINVYLFVTLKYILIIIVLIIQNVMTNSALLNSYKRTPGT